MQTATSETERKSLVLSICVHHYTLRAPCPKRQGITALANKRDSNLSCTNQIAYQSCSAILILVAVAQDDRIAISWRPTSRSGPCTWTTFVTGDPVFMCRAVKWAWTGFPPVQDDHWSDDTAASAVRAVHACSCEPDHGEPHVKLDSRSRRIIQPYRSSVQRAGGNWAPFTQREGASGANASPWPNLAWRKGILGAAVVSTRAFRQGCLPASRWWYHGGC